MGRLFSRKWMFSISIMWLSMPIVVVVNRLRHLLSRCNGSFTLAHNGKIAFIYIEREKPLFRYSLPRGEYVIFMDPFVSNKSEFIDFVSALDEENEFVFISSREGGFVRE